MLLFPTDTVSANELLFKIARHNFTSFVVSDFDLELMNFGRLGLLIVKGFENLSELNNYRRVMAQSTTLQLPPQVRPVIISVADFEKLINEGRSFEEYFNYAREQMYIATEEEVLPPEIFGPSEGMPKEGEEQEDVQPEIVPEAVEAEENADERVQNVEGQGKPEVKTDEPAQPEQKAQPEKPAQPQTKQPAPQKPEQKTKPAAQPQKPMPKKPAQTMPEYPTGSEGDDPLLE